MAAITDRRGLFARTFGSAIALQALLSATNLLIGLVLIRRTSNTEYGYYVLATTATLLATGLQNAYIQPPLVIRMTRADAAERADLIGGVYRGQRRALALLTAVALLVLGMLAVTGLTDTSHTVLGLAFIGAMCAALYRDFFRTVLLSHRHAFDVLKADLAYGALILVGVPLATLTPLAGAAAIGAMALACLAGGLLLHRSLWRLEPWNRHAGPGALRELAHLGTWSALGSGTHWAFSQGYNYVVAGTLDVGAVAALAATRLLMMPVNLLSSGISSLMMATATAWLHAHGPVRLFRRLLMIATGLAALAMIYFILVWFARDLIFTHLMHKQFPQSGALVAAWSAVFLVMIFRDQMNFFPGASGLHRRLLGVTAAAAVISLGTGHFALQRIGVLGAPVGVLIGELFNLGGIFYLSAVEIRRQRLAGAA